FEARDSLVMRLAVRLGLTMDYELNAIDADGRGGVANSAVPNFIYRWTERGVRATIASYDPASVPDIEFFHDLRLPIQRLARSRQTILRILAIAIEPLSKAFAAIAPKQCNEFAFAIFKSGEMQPWIQMPRTNLDHPCSGPVETLFGNCLR